MEKFVIKKKNKNKKIQKFNFEEMGYVFTPNIKSDGMIKITELSMSNVVYTHPILKKKLDKSFRKLASLILNVLESEDTTAGDVVIALNELTKEKSVLQRKYKEYIKKEEKEKYLKRLKVLEEQLKQKMLYIQMAKPVYEEERIEGHSR